MIHLAPLKLNSELPTEQYAKRLAALTPGFSGADLANLCNEAAILAARNNKDFVDRTDFEAAAERVIGGLERSKKLDKKEKQVVAYHESGHAAAAWFLQGADPVLKVSILPRSKGALGFAQFLPNETMLYSKDELLDKICATLGGRVAEEIFFHKVTTGAQNDLQKATEIAMALVTSFGMSERLGPIGYSMDREAFGKPFSQMTNRLIDEDVRAIVQSCLERTRALLTEKKPLVEKLALKLLEKERVLHHDLEEALGPRPFPVKSEYEKYVKEDQAATSS
jgi:AFG3 family protein